MEGQVSATIGTSGVVFAAVDGFYENRNPAIQSFCSAIPGRWCLFGCMLTAGGALDWYLHSVNQKKSSFDKLIQLAEKSPRGSKGLVFLPYLDGERCPYPNPDARGGWIGLRREHDSSDLTRSVVEGVTFGLKDQLELLAEAGIEVQEIRSSGGGAKSRFWLGLQADIFEKTVLKLKTPHASAMGAALLAMTGAQLYGSIFEACQKLVTIEERFYPDRKNEAVYETAYQRFHSLYPKLQTWFGSTHQ
jgi:xylulokinase